MNRDNHVKYIEIRKLFSLANGQRLHAPHEATRKKLPTNFILLHAMSWWNNLDMSGTFSTGIGAE